MNTSPSNRQYVAVQFNPWDRRTYTYHYDGEALQPDDKVDVITGQGVTSVTVVSITDQLPSFETKAIVGKTDAETANQESGS